MSAPCAVLGCDRPATVSVDLNRPADPLLETLVCAAHGTRIERGERWAWSEQVRAVLLGADLAARSSGR